MLHHATGQSFAGPVGEGPSQNRFLLGADIPDHTSVTSGKARRQTAALITSQGPPKQQFRLRPLRREPGDSVMDGFLMLEACNVDDAEQVEVRGTTAQPLA